MKILISIALLILNQTAFGSDTDSSISFISATKTDNLIVLGKIISYPSYDSTKALCPRRMIVQVLEVLKGNDSSKLITVEGSDSSNSNNLACLYFFQIGTFHILGLENLKLVAQGNHSLDYLNGIVRGNISNEPTSEYSNKFKKIFEKLQKEELNKNKNNDKVKLLRKELETQSNLLNQTMDYKTFKEAFTH